MITKRSRIQMRWSTNPEDMGYGRDPSPERLPGKPDYIGSPRTVLAEAYRIQQNVGMGTYMRVEFRHGDEVVSRDELRSLTLDD